MPDCFLPEGDVVSCFSRSCGGVPTKSNSLLGESSLGNGILGRDLERDLDLALGFGIIVDLSFDLDLQVNNRRKINEQFHMCLLKLAISLNFCLFVYS